MHVAYTLRDSHVLEYTRRTAAGWSTPVIAQTGVDEQAELSIDQAGGVVIAYGDTTRRAVAGAKWQRAF